MKLTKNIALIGLTIGVLSVSSIGAQGVSQTQQIASSDALSQISMFNYRPGPKSKLTLQGTPIAANAFGKAEVEYQDGNARISMEVDDLPAPSTLGPYTTYVVWALSPDGRAVNQGVLASEAGKGQIETSYGASQFALIVTAEPHFAVSAPSTMMALYNVADKVEADVTRVTTLTERSDYSALKPIAGGDDKENPMELAQARYSVEIARAAGAERYAPQEFAAARQSLTAAESAFTGGKKDRKAASDASRSAVVAGEDARRAAMIGASEAQAEAERQAAAAAATEAAAVAAQAAAVAARNNLRTQLNAVLPTNETERGLVSEIAGLQFASGTANLSAPARESLARFSGIVAQYPDIRIKIEGHTDSTGTVEKNNELSLRRAQSVSAFLIGQGIAASRIAVEGFGPSKPATENTTAEGRARNRRVELVLSGGLLTS